MTICEIICPARRLFHEKYKGYDSIVRTFKPLIRENAFIHSLEFEDDQLDQVRDVYTIETFAK